MAIQGSLMVVALLMNLTVNARAERLGVGTHDAYQGGWLCDVEIDVYSTWPWRPSGIRKLLANPPKHQGPGLQSRARPQETNGDWTVSQIRESYYDNTPYNTPGYISYSVAITSTTRIRGIIQPLFSLSSAVVVINIVDHLVSPLGLKAPKCRSHSCIVTPCLTVQQIRVLCYNLFERFIISHPLTSFYTRNPTAFQQHKNNKNEPIRFSFLPFPSVEPFLRLWWVSSMYPCPVSLRVS